ncbi:unnamed protein product [Adineta ricciae]|uniref:Uncharacterized protein n=1 Tax=Adineta ricciae TaxID=249248 RepID=A0A815BP15_ADIRI|nr:unnamed protein product [Adineta ricciae]
MENYPSTFRATPASTFLYNSSLSIDAYHYCNRVDKWYKEHLSPDKNDIVKRTLKKAVTYHEKKIRMIHGLLPPFTQFGKTSALILNIKAHLSSTYDLRIDLHAFFPIHQLQLQQHSIEDNEGQHIDLPDESQTAPTAFVTRTNDPNDTNSSSLTTAFYAVILPYKTIPRHNNQSTISNSDSYQN